MSLIGTFLLSWLVTAYVFQTSSSMPVASEVRGGQGTLLSEVAIWWPQSRLVGLLILHGMGFFGRPKIKYPFGWTCGNLGRNQLIGYLVGE